MYGYKVLIMYDILYILVHVLYCVTAVFIILILLIINKAIIGST